MTPEQFVYWLKGRVAVSEGPPHAMAWADILDELRNVEMMRVPPLPYAEPLPQPSAPWHYEPDPPHPPYRVTYEYPQRVGTAVDPSAVYVIDDPRTFYADLNARRAATTQGVPGAAA